jgi:hypothetical protein
MHSGRVWVTAVCTCGLLAFAAPSCAQGQTFSGEQWIDLFVQLCVGGGSTNMASGTIQVNQTGGTLTLNNIGPNNQTTGQVTITKNDFRLLPQGIDNNISSLQPAEADKVRDCLAPVRQQILYAMANPIQGEINILSPYKNSVVRALAQEKGIFGDIGKNNSDKSLREATRYSEIRTRVILHYLQSKGMVLSLPAWEGCRTLQH